MGARMLMDPEDRATFIVRLRKVGAAGWHGIVELVDGQRRRHVSGPRELTEFIDRAFEERAGAVATADRQPPGGEQ
jgi:hypothetical protein